MLKHFIIITFINLIMINQGLAQLDLPVDWSFVKDSPRTKWAQEWPGLFKKWHDEIEREIDSDPRHIDTKHIDFLKFKESKVNDFSCSQKIDYFRSKLKQAISPRQLLESIDRNPPQVLLVGDTHTVQDYHHMYRQLEAAYGRKDCVFHELPPDPRWENIIIEGRKYYEKTHDAGYAIRLYAKDRDLQVRPEVVDGGLWLHVGKSEIQPQHAEELWEDDVKEFLIDDREDFENRDLFMAKYITRLVQSGMCHHAIFFTGQGHLAPQKRLLNENNISVYSVDFLPLNSFTRIGSDEKYPGAFEYPDCTLPHSEIPVHPIVIETGVSHNGPILSGIAGKELHLKWSAFDAALIVPVVKTDPEWSNNRFIPLNEKVFSSLFQ